MLSSAPVDARFSRTARASALLACAEIALIFLLMAAYGGTPPPDVNESHYLAKAKHVWDPQWCERDFFLQSADAHLAFFLGIGWMTRWLSLEATAWVVRILGWLLLAMAWRRLSRTVSNKPLSPVLTAAWLLGLIHWGALSGEWLVGGVEAKTFAYGLGMLGLADLVQQRPTRAWLWLGTAALLHVIVGGWLCVAAGFAWLAFGRERPPLKNMLPGMLVGALLAMPSVFVGLSLNNTADAATVQKANEILVYDRLAHHLWPPKFLPLHMWRFAIMATCWALLAIWLLWRKRTNAAKTEQQPAKPHDELAINSKSSSPAQVATSERALRWVQLVAAGSIALMLVGMLITLLAHWQADLAASLLKYYWFRLADVMVPVGTALAVVGAIERVEARHGYVGQWLLVAALILPTIALAPIVHTSVQDRRPRSVTVWDYPKRPMDVRRQRYLQWRAMCAWVQQNTPEDALALTPWPQQTFKWYAQRAEVFNWKDVPQDATSLVEWQRRRNTVYPRAAFLRGHSALSDDQLLAIARRYQAEYLVLQRWRMVRSLGPAFQQVYPNAAEDNTSFAVYYIQLPTSGDRQRDASER